MPDSERVSLFLASMIVDYEMCHDGIGYNLEVLDEMTEVEKATVVANLLEKGVKDWRDLEALDRLNTPSAFEAILQVRNSTDEELRLRAQQYGPKPDEADVEAAILAGLASESSKSKAIDQAAKHSTPKVIAALLQCAKDESGTDAYQAVATLFYIHGKIDSPHSWAHRKFFLRFVEPHSEDKAEAFAELCRKLKIKP